MRVLEFFLVWGFNSFWDGWRGRRGKVLGDYYVGIVC